GPAELDALSLVWVGHFEDPLQPPQPLPDSAAGSMQKGAKALYPKPPVYSRSSWNADAPQCSSSYCTTTHIAVHHTASSADYSASTWSQAAGNVKSIQAYHMYTNGWCDIGYNYLVSKQGWIFEGRGGGDDVKGAHDGFNCGSMGVAALGYFHTPVNNPTTTALLDAYEELGAWKCDQQGIAPLGSSYYAGYGATMTNVYGHRNVKSTACPGDLLYAKLGEIRSGIAARLAGTPSSGTLKGVLYDASIGTTARLVGTVALSSGTFVKTGSDGYYEFPLPAGSYSFAGTSPGHAIGSDSETVSSGDVWQSLGLWPASTVPTHTSTDVGFNLFNTTFQGDVGSPVWLGYAGSVGLPLAPFAAAGTLWIDLGSAQTLYLGSVPSGGVLSVNLSASGAPAGIILHTQGYVLWQGQARLTNGAAWVGP
ncbi:MAG: N-acetylmuramoyl-L-alanine amidase, partial [Planctomycetota bacterium]|nr:N-acetylmuramoyl-L-alanine amidase [Planctomycetota bacterium]